jgi:hypothetical protein
VTGRASGAIGIGEPDGRTHENSLVVRIRLACYFEASLYFASQDRESRPRGNPGGVAQIMNHYTTQGCNCDFVADIGSGTVPTVTRNTSSNPAASSNETTRLPNHTRH